MSRQAQTDDPQVTVYCPSSHAARKEPWVGTSGRVYLEAEGWTLGAQMAQTKRDLSKRTKQRIGPKKQTKQRVAQAKTSKGHKAGFVLLSYHF